MKLGITIGCAFAALGVSLLAAVPMSAQIFDQNQYVCRKAKDLKIPAKFPGIPGVSTADEVAPDNCELKKLFLYCSPAIVNGGPIDNAALHYCCYKAKCGQKPAVNFSITDQFGNLGIQTKKPFVVCSPCQSAPF